MQQPSTRAALSQSLTERQKHRESPVPKESQVKDENGEVFLNHRPLSFQETSTEESLRRKRGKLLADMRKEPAPKSISEEQKNRAKDAFMDKFSPKVIYDKFKDLMKGVFKPSHAEIVATEMKKLNGDK